MYGLTQTIISQFGTSPAITAILNSMNAAIDPTANLQNFYSIVWDIENARGFGLDNLGLIIGVSRYLEIPLADTYFGFYGTSNAPFNVAPFFIGGSSADAYALSDAQYRTLLLAKAYANVSRASIENLNTLVQAVFGSGAMFVADLGNMAMAYVFTAVPTAVDSAIANQSGVLPHPTGVAVSVRTALVNNATLIAATSGSDIGYGSGFGSLTPSADINGNTITALYATSSSLVLTITGASVLPASGYFTDLTLNGVSYAQSSAAYTYSGLVATWTWTESAAVLASGDTYTTLIT